MTVARQLPWHSDADITLGSPWLRCNIGEMGFRALKEARAPRPGGLRLWYGHSDANGALAATTGHSHEPEGCACGFRNADVARGCRACVCRLVISGTTGLALDLPVSRSEYHQY